MIIAICIWVGILLIVGAFAFVSGYGLGGLHEVQAEMHRLRPEKYPGPKLGPLTKILHGRPHPESGEHKSPDLGAVSPEAKYRPGYAKGAGE